MPTLHQEIQEILSTYDKTPVHTGKLTQYPQFFSVLTHYYHDLLENHRDHKEYNLICKIYRQIQSELIGLFQKKQSRTLEHEPLLISLADTKTFDVFDNFYKNQYPMSNLLPPEKNDRALIDLINRFKDNTHNPDQKNNFFYEKMIIAEYFTLIQVEKRTQVFYAWADYLFEVRLFLDIKEIENLAGMLCKHDVSEERHKRLTLLNSQEKYHSLIPFIFEDHHKKYWEKDLQTIFKISFHDIAAKKNPYQLLFEITDLVKRLSSLIHGWICFSETHWSSGLVRPIHVGERPFSLDDFFHPNTTPFGTPQIRFVQAMHLNLGGFGDLVESMFDNLFECDLNSILSDSSVWELSPYVLILHEAFQLGVRQLPRISYHIQTKCLGQNPYDSLKTKVRILMMKLIFSHFSDNPSWSRFYEQMKKFAQTAQNQSPGILIIDLAHYPDKPQLVEVHGELSSKVLLFRNFYLNTKKPEFVLEDFQSAMEKSVGIGFQSSAKNQTTLKESAEEKSYRCLQRI